MRLDMLNHSSEHHSGLGMNVIVRLGYTVAMASVHQQVDQRHTTPRTEGCLGSSGVTGELSTVVAVA
jgi:hypothetical protein